MIMCAEKAGGIVANKNYPVDFFNENIMKIYRTAIKLIVCKTSCYMGR